MLNVYRDFNSNLIEQLILYYENLENIESGKYYCDFVDIDKCVKFSNSLKDHNEQYIKDFILTIPETLENITLKSIKIKDHNFIVAIESDLGSDFMVKLRNMFDDMKNTSIIFICYTTIDSIFKGSLNMQGSGQVFSPKEIKKFIINMIDDLAIDKNYKDFIDALLDLRATEFSNRDIFEYENILNTMDGEELTNKKLNQLGLVSFDLDSFKAKKSQDQRIKVLKDSEQLFADVAIAQEVNDYNTSFEGVVENSFFKKLKDSVKMEDDILTIDFTLEDYEKTVENKRMESKSNIAYKGLEGYNVKYIDRKNSNKIFIVIDNSTLAEDSTLTFNFSEPPEKPKRVDGIELIKQNKNIILKINDKSYGITNFKVQKKNKTFEVKILKLPFIPEFIEKYKSDFSLTNKVLYIKNESVDELYINEEFEEVTKITSDITKYKIDLLRTKKILLETEEEDVKFILDVNGIKIECIINRLNSTNLGKDMHVMESEILEADITPEIEFDLEGNFNRYILQNNSNIIRNEYKFFLNIERFMLENKCMFVKIIGNENYCGSELDLPEELKNSYFKMFEAFTNENMSISTQYWTSHQLNSVKDLLEVYVKTLKDMYQSQKCDGSEVFDISRIGFVFDEVTSELYASPFAIHNLAFQYKIFESEINNSQNEMISDIFKYYSSSNHVYFVNVMAEMETKYYSIASNNMKYWTNYIQREYSGLGETARVLKKITFEKIKDLYKTYPILFEKNEISINVVNLSTDLEVLKGIIEFHRFYKNKLKRKYNGFAINVNIYINSNEESSFEKLFNITDIESFNTFIGDMRNKNEFTREYILELQKSIKISKSTIDKNMEYKSAEISFYKMNDKIDDTSIKYDRFSNTLRHKGLLSINNINVDYKKESTNGYFMGPSFKGIKEGNVVEETLMFANIVQQSTIDPRAELTMNLHSTYIEQSNDMWLNFMDNSIWLTVIEPEVDYNFFNRNDDVDIIHYTDQYTNSSKIDAITISNKTGLFKTVLKKIEDMNHENLEEEIFSNILKTFYTINGNWLLEMIGNKNQYSISEKFSVVATMIYYFDEFNKKEDGYLWVPISFGEIIRASKAIGLDQSSVFSSESGKKSDDVLVIGVKVENYNVDMKFKIIEVKHGNTTNHKAKATEQLEGTLEHFKTQYIENDNYLKKEFFNFFFLEIYLTNLNKHLSNVCKDIVIEFDNINELTINANFAEEFLYNMNFSNDVTSYKVDYDNEIKYEQRPYSEIKSIITKQIDPRNAISFNGFIFNVQNQFKTQEENSKIEFEQETIEPINTDNQVNPYNNIIYDHNQSDVIVTINAKENEGSISNNEIPNLDLDSLVEEFENIEEYQDKFEIGNLDSGRSVNLYYNTDKISNNHLFAIGKSGSGKSYALQKIIGRMQEQGGSPIIIDYSDSFRRDQLPAEFIDLYDNSINYITVIRDRIKVNPFAPNKIVLGDGTDIMESAGQIGTRVSSIFATIDKGTGTVQKSSMRKSIIQGINNLGDNFDLEAFGEILIEENESAFNRLSDLFDNIPFENGISDWNQLLSNNKINIISLTGYNQDVKNLITEILVWDLFNFMQSNEKGKFKASLVMDEVQNLGISDNSPIYKILSEGRKFDISVALATQSFIQLGKFGESMISNAATKMYFSIVETEINKIKNKLSLDDQETQELSSLQKGVAYIDGKFEIADKTIDATNKIKISKIQ